MGKNPKSLSIAVVRDGRGSALQRFIDGPSRIDDVDLGELLLCLLRFEVPRTGDCCLQGCSKLWSVIKTSPGRVK